jgi:hypothetical protein
MHLGEAGAAEREVPAAVFDEPDQLGRVAEPALVLDEVALAARRVPAQGEDVLDPGRLDLVERRRQPLGRLADAAEVRPISSFSRRVISTVPSRVEPPAP